jgi:hypothetical protein
MFDVRRSFPPRSPSPASEKPPQPSAGKWNCASCRFDVNSRALTPFIGFTQLDADQTFEIQSEQHFIDLVRGEA